MLLATHCKRVLIDRRSNCEWAVQHNDGVEPKSQSYTLRTLCSCVRCGVMLLYCIALYCGVLKMCVSVVVQLFTIIFHCRLFCLSLRNRILCSFSSRSRSNTQRRMNGEKKRRKYGTIKFAPFKYTSMHDDGNGPTNALLTLFLCLSIPHSLRC